MRCLTVKLVLLYIFICVAFIDLNQYSFANTIEGKYVTQKYKVLYPDTNKIDSIIYNGIQNKAYPGCQIFVSVNGKVVYNKSYGYFTYADVRKVKNTDMYDLASLTKVTATTLCIMKLVDEKKINLDERLSKYLSYLLNTNKESMTIREVMAHQACLTGWVPFYKKTLISQKSKVKSQKAENNGNENNLNSSIYNNHKTEFYSVQVAKNVYMRNDYRDSIYQEIVKTPLLKSENGMCKYHYSDLGFYLLADLIHKVTGKRLNEYVDESFYKPMGLKRITFCPLDKFRQDEIVPTADDTVFRHQLLQGYVQDPGAAMLGGVSGHAGLFADASDLGELMQMLLQNGSYKGRQYISAATVKEFTRCQYPENGNRRGLGFDKQLLTDTRHKTQDTRQKELNVPCAADASKSSYGHSGYTGTFLWVDPEYKLVYVFLSNRVYPDENNKKLAEMNIRTDIQEVIYNGIVH